ncbi:MAG: hypothetical protein WC943_09905 [Elusimicrobiota bacterium]|jgi:hypothetical protein
MSDPDLPGLSDLFALVVDEQNNPQGIQPVPERLDEAAAGLEPESVLEALESAKDPAAAASAVFLATRAAKRGRGLAPDLEKALLHLVSDTRTAEASVGGVLQVFDLAACAFGAYFELIRLRARDVVAILGVLGACLVNPRRADLAAAAVRQFQLLFKDDPKYERASEEVAELLADAVEDPALSPSTRVRAYEAIVCGSRFSVSGRHPHPVADKVFGKQRVRGAEALVAALEGGPAKPELREYVLRNLDTIRPEAIAPLQDKGVLQLGTIPDPKDLVDLGLQAPDPAKAARASLGLKPEQVLEALKGGEDDPRVLAAVLLSPFFARRMALEALAGRLIELSASDARLDLVLGEKRALFQLGREAGLALLSLLRSAPVEIDAAALEWLFKGLDAVLSRGVNASWVPNGPVMDYLHELHSRESETKGRLQRTMQDYLTVPGRPAKARIAAFCTYRNIEAAADAWAQSAMLNPKEDPEFAGLLRTLTH